MPSELASEGRDIYAVVGSPHSRVPVQAPTDPREARRVKGGNAFYCSANLGGCGGELTFAIGEVNIPHFRHQPGSRCSLMASKSLADRYTHLAIQEALRSWIESMAGLTCHLEVSIENGRTDVLATGPSFEVALEVQRSALSARNAQVRTAVYSGRADAVHWLYASKEIDAYKAEIADRGWSLRVWWGWAKRECRLGVSYEAPDEAESEVREVGGPLVDWEISASGLDSVHLRQAKESVERRRAAERDRRQQEAAAEALREAAQREKEAAARKQQVEWQKAAQASLTEALKQTPEGLVERWPSSWSQLRGSAKQVGWAESIRSRMVGLLREELDMGWLPQARGVPVARWLALQTSAAFWIHCRWMETLDMILLYEDEYGPSGS